ncbi:MAG: hypothetical protein K2K97_00290, partial [Muribaculaceae bacterium]|nr:hypothetical protein [Muribaculaceae bacterium]
MALEILMPNDGSISGRSSTNDDGTSTAEPGTEVGSNEENKVKSVAVVLAKKDNTFITYGLVYTDRIAPKANSNSYESVAKFSKSDFESYYKDDNFEQEVNVFVFCNPTSDLLTTLNAISFSEPNTTWVNAACEVKAGISNMPDVNTSIWADNSFLMSNASIATRLLPKEYDDWDSYRKPEEAFNLSGVNLEGSEKEVDNLEKGGAIKVERVVARLDYKDGSRDGNHIYDVLTSMKVDADGNTTDGPYFIKVDLGRMCLVNMSNQFYYLPRVSDTGLATNAKLCGSETSKNYVVGPYYEKFNKAASELEQAPESYGYANYFNYPFFNSNGKLDGEANYDRWFTSNVDDVLGGNVLDDWNNKHDYHVWRYATENVIPGVQNQKNGISTGIVFKAKLMADASIFTDKSITYPDADELIKYLNNVGDSLKGDGADPFLYMFSNRLYLKWEAVRDAVKKECVVLTYTTDKKEPDVTINSNTPLYIAVYG